MRMFYFLFILICAMTPRNVQAGTTTNDDHTQVATAKWTEEKIDAARGLIPSGGADSAETAQIWVQ